MLSTHTNSMFHKLTHEASAMKLQWNLFYICVDKMNIHFSSFSYLFELLRYTLWYKKYINKTYTQNMLHNYFLSQPKFILAIDTLGIKWFFFFLKGSPIRFIYYYSPEHIFQFSKFTSQSKNFQHVFHLFWFQSPTVLPIIINNCCSIMLSWLFICVFA